MASWATGGHKRGAIVSAPEQPQKPSQPDNRDAEIIALLQQIVELLDNIDSSLAYLGGEVGSIRSSMP